MTALPWDIFERVVFFLETPELVQVIYTCKSAAALAIKRAAIICKCASPKGCHRPGKFFLEVCETMNPDKYHEQLAIAKRMKVVNVLFHKERRDNAYSILGITLLKDLCDAGVLIRQLKYHRHDVIHWPINQLCHKHVDDHFTNERPPFIWSQASQVVEHHQVLLWMAETRMSRLESSLYETRLEMRMLQDKMRRLELTQNDSP